MHRSGTGIWLDFKDAYIVNISKGKQTGMQHLRSGVEHKAVKGGTRSKTPWGPQYSPSDKSVLEKEMRDEQRYFEEIIRAIPDDTEALVIFGPAEAKIGLKKAIEDIKHFSPTFYGALSADYMTQNQIAALFRDFFANPEQYAGREE